MIALIDCNSFYCSCEQVFRPDLANKPIVVLSNNDGCIIARNTQAKKLGIPMGSPYHEYKAFLKQHMVHVFSANMSLYANFSNRVMRILQDISPSVSIYSIDEAFIEITNQASIGKHIKETILKQTGIPVSVGIAPTHVLAKCANALAKKYPELNGVCILTQTNEIDLALKKIAIENVWGIGRKQAKRCRQLAIQTAHDLKQFPNKTVLLKKLTITGRQIQDELNQQSCITIHTIHTERKSIRSSRSFKTTIVSYSRLLAAMITFLDHACIKLRQQSSTCEWITIFIRTNPFKKDDNQYSNSICLPMPYQSNNLIHCIQTVRSGLRAIYKDGYKYKKAGVILSGLHKQSHQQLSIFQPQTQLSSMHAYDTINQRYGKNTITIATTLMHQPYKSSGHQLSNKFTTNWNELLTV